MTHHRSCFFFLTAITSLLVGCPQPSARANADATLADGALVIEANTPYEEEWSAYLTVRSATGDYLLFESHDRPTSLAGLNAFDPDNCGVGCSVPGLGRYASKGTPDDTGTVSLSTGSRTNGDESWYLVLVRRQPTMNPPPLAVKIIVDIEGEGGCDGGNPDPPEIKTELLKR